VQPFVTRTAAFLCILAGPVLSVVFEQGALHGFDHQLQAFHRAALATLACYGVVIAVSAATQGERDSDREQYTWSRFRNQRQSGSSAPRPWWQSDKLWAGILVTATLGMCWFFR
jgi:hypothetical protein